MITKTMKLNYKIIPIIVSIMLISCQYIPTVNKKELNAVYVKKAEAEAQIEKLKETHAKDLTDNLNKQAETQKRVIDGQDIQLQMGADGLYSIVQGVQTFPAPGSMEFVKDRAIEGFTAMGKPPTIKEIMTGGERLKKYLTTYKDSNLVEIEKLKKEHDQLVIENGILVKNTEAVKKEVEAVIAAKTQIETKYTADTAAAQLQLNDANNKVIDKEHQRAEQEKLAKEHAENIEHLKKQLMLWCGIGAVIAIIGIIYSPVCKGGIGIIAAILGAATIIIPFITATMIWLVVGAGLFAAIGVAAAFLYKHHIIEKSNENMINAIDDTTSKPNATIADLKTNLKEWNTVYVKDTAGNIITKADDAVEKYIQDKLIKLGKL